MLGFDCWPFSRCRSDSGSVRDRVEPKVRERIEPTLPPIGDRVRIRLRYNDRMACALTDVEAALHDMSVADSWRDCMGAAPAREVVVDVPLPQFANPGPSHISAAPTGDDVPATPDPVSMPPPTPLAAPMPAPTPVPKRPAVLYSPAEHASRLLAWCRRAGLVGELTIDGVQAAYAEMCRAEGLLQRPWNPVSREFTVLVAGRVGVKTYVNRGHSKVRVFRVPTLSPAQPASPQARAGASAVREQERAAA